MIIIYRATENNTKSHDGRPSWFDKRKCFKSLIDAINNHNIVEKIYVVFDGASKGELFNYINQFKIELIPIELNSNQESLIYCLDLSKKLTFESVYFLEDDYLHLPEAIKVIDEGLTFFGLVSAYDHMDRYLKIDDPDINLNKESIYLTESCHWRTAESTTGTWACISKLHTKIIDKAIYHHVYDRIFFRDLIEMGIRLHTPIPGRSTHVGSLKSPFTDWEKFNETITL
jgi:hypothetical protein